MIDHTVAMGLPKGTAFAWQDWLSPHFCSLLQQLYPTLYSMKGGWRVQRGGYEGSVVYTHCLLHVDAVLIVDTAGVADTKRQY